jgi:hypothetical protein
MEAKSDIAFEGDGTHQSRDFLDRLREANLRKPFYRAL